VNLHYMVSQVGAMAVGELTNLAYIRMWASTGTGLIRSWKTQCQDAKWSCCSREEWLQECQLATCPLTSWRFIITTEAATGHCSESVQTDLLRWLVRTSTSYF